MLPTTAPRQPRTAPTASTTVIASVNSTSEARNAASAEVPACVQPIANAMRQPGPMLSWPAM